MPPPQPRSNADPPRRLVPSAPAPAQADVPPPGVGLALGLGLVGPAIGHRPPSPPTQCGLRVQTTVISAVVTPSWLWIATWTGNSGRPPASNSATTSPAGRPSRASASTTPRASFLYAISARTTSGVALSNNPANDPNTIAPEALSPNVNNAPACGAPTWL